MPKERGDGAVADYPVADAEPALAKRRVTKAELLSRFGERTNQLFHGVQRDTYVDTVQVLLRRKLTAQQLWNVIVLNRNADSVRPEWRPWSDYPCLIRIHQPKPQTVGYLQEIAPDHIVNRLDVALDFSTTSVEAAMAMDVFLARHIVQPWHGKRRGCVVSGTHYHAQAWRGRNIVTYQPESKASGRPAAHLEIRIYGARACKRYGARQLKDVDGIDLDDVIARNCRLAILDWRKVTRAIDAAVGSALLIHNRDTRRPINRFEMTRRFRAILCRSMQLPDWVPTTEELPLVPIREWVDWHPDLIRGAMLCTPLVKATDHRNSTTTPWIG